LAQLFVHFRNLLSGQRPESENVHRQIESKQFCVSYCNLLVGKVLFGHFFGDFYFWLIGLVG